MVSYWDQADGEEMSKQAVMSSASLVLHNTGNRGSDRETHHADVSSWLQTHIGLHSGRYATELSSLRDFSVSPSSPLTLSINCACNS